MSTQVVELYREYQQMAKDDKIPQLGQRFTKKFGI